jgi:hypothetical protein
VRKRITLLFAAVTMALTMSLSGVAFAALEDQPGRGNPTVNKGGNCPGGHNKDEPGNAFSNKC